MRSTSSGIPDLDDLLAGLLPGDNVVWVTAGHSQIAAIERSFLMDGLRGGEPCSYVTTELSPNRLRSEFGGDLQILDARPGRSLADPTTIEMRILNDARQEPGRVVVDSLDAFVRRLDRSRALGLFSRVCPQLYDLGAIAYWRVSRAAAGARLVEGITKVTQCVLELGVSHLRVVKAEGRPGAEGRLLHLRSDPDGTPAFEQEKALGRLGAGLRRIRKERRLSQADLARLAGVSPSAISQAEAGHRGLALETLLTLVESLGVGLDDLLAVKASGDYVLARRDRLGAPQGHVALLDDDSAGLRAYLIQLSPGQRGTPPVPTRVSNSSSWPAGSCRRTSAAPHRSSGPVTPSSPHGRPWPAGATCSPNQPACSGSSETDGRPDAIPPPPRSLIGDGGGNRLPKEGG